MRISRCVRWPAVVVAGALAATACGSFEGSTTSGSGSADNLTVSLQFTPRANYSLETDDAFVLSQVGCLETLVKYDAEAGALVPLLATEWVQTEPTAWDFTLRDGVKFQDGTDLTAAAVVASLQYLLQADAPPRAFTPKLITSVEALNDSTVRVRTPEPSALVPFRLASINTGILSPAAYTGTGIDPLSHCTGPYTPVAQTPAQSMTLEGNAAYWGGNVPLESVTARFIPEGATRATQVRTGESQIALGLPASTVPELEGDARIKVSSAFTPRTTGLYFNQSRAPFDNPDVRKAVQAAVDVESITSSVFGGQAHPAIGPFAPTEAWAPDSPPVNRNPDQARRLLTAAGYAPGQLKLTLLAYTERPEFADLAAVIQANLAEIGIDVSVQVSDYSAIEPSLLDGAYDLALLSRNHLTDIADPLGFLTADYSCGGGFNISQYCDPAIDAQLSAANTENDPQRRNAIYADIAAQLQADAVTTFIAHEQTTAARLESIESFVDDPLARYAVTPDLTVSNS